ncbi:YibE/F family protein [Aminobacterium colombiense]|nr:YibE/F family protein [Aminobacterium colombiense]MDD3767544.1 YibE/F family protein [Aminobacterium colombiense]MDD4586325.1 YibE/F family protein [Aminobacterium colombiense]
MTTTLLLAYFGGYLTLLMLFARQNTVFVRVINYRIIAAKILRTMAGV